MDAIAFFNIPAFGHISSTLPVVEHLVDQGARVLYYVDEMYRDPVAATGAEVRSMPNFTSAPDARMPTSIVNFAYTMVEQTFYGMPYLLEQLEAEGVGLVVHDHVCLWGNCVAKVRGLPAVRTSGILRACDPVIPRAKVPLRIILRELRHLPDLIRFRRLVSRLHREYGVRRFGVAGAFGTRGDLNILFTSREYLPHSERLDPSYRLVGASISDRAGETLELPDLGGRPLVYISLGTLLNQRTDFYKTCQAAFGSEDVYVVLSLGSRVDPATLGPWPDNFHVASFVPQLDVLKRASVFVSQAGGCGVNESLVYGVPLVMWPQAGDHVFNADCVVAQGAGVRLGDEDITPDRLREETLRVLREPRYQVEAKRIGATLLEAGGARRAADEILAFQRSQPTRAPAG